MANKPKRLAGPVALTTTMTTNVYNPVTNLYGLIRGIEICNKTASAATFSLWVGATGGNAAGTELFNAYSVPANSTYTWYAPGQGLRMDTTDFLVGGASANTALTATVMGEEAAV